MLSARISFHVERIEEIVAGTATPTIKLHYYMLLPVGHLSSGETLLQAAATNIKT